MSPMIDLMDGSFESILLFSLEELVVVFPIYLVTHYLLLPG